jgi:hypothetical protein
MGELFDLSVKLCTSFRARPKNNYLTSPRAKKNGKYLLAFRLVLAVEDPLLARVVLVEALFGKSQSQIIVRRST